MVSGSQYHCGSMLWYMLGSKHINLLGIEWVWAWNFLRDLNDSLEC